jgi:hypothetical protein
VTLCLARLRTLVETLVPRPVRDRRLAQPPLQRHLARDSNRPSTGLPLVCAEIVEPVSLREPIKPLLLGNFGTRQIWLGRGVIDSSSAIAVPRRVVSRARCLTTSSRTRSGRSKTTHPRVARAESLRKSDKNAGVLLRLAGCEGPACGRDERVEGGEKTRGRRGCEGRAGIAHTTFVAPSEAGGIRGANDESGGGGRLGRFGRGRWNPACHAGESCKRRLRETGAGAPKAA